MFSLLKLTKYKSYIFILVFAFSIKLTAQNENVLLNLIKQPVKTAKTKELAMLKKISNVSLDTVEKIVEKPMLIFKVPEKDWIKEFWDSNRFNPYPYFGNDYPFQIKFEDNTYSSPINRDIVITSHYGKRGGGLHKGIDIDLKTGDSIKSILPGVVRFCKYHYGHGKTVVIRHYNGLETVYAHMSKQIVKVNDSVKKGQVIGLGGTTGNARGSHLHLEVLYNGVCLNPEYFFEFDKDNIIRSKNFWVTSKWATPNLHNSTKQSDIIVSKTNTALADASKLKSIKELDDEEEDRELKVEKRAEKFKKPVVVLHVVKPGDSLYVISKKYKVSIQTLCKLNSMKSSEVLKIGKKLVVKNT